ncbi:MAG: sulfotransferase domain-containing protein [Anaerolineales bacterium]
MFGEYSIWGRCEKAKIGPAINFSHDGLNWTWQTPDDISYEKNLKPYCGKKILFLTRYPLDVVVSNWAYFRYLNAHYQNSVNAFIKDPVHSVEKFVRFHNLWANHRSEFPEIMLLRYEDVRNNPKEKFAELIHYLGFNYDEKLLMEAINFASLENMRGMQKSLKDVPFLKTKNYIYIGDENNPESRHVRKGEIGGYRKYLDPDMVDHYEKIIGLNLDPWFGYEAPVA